MIRAQNPEWHGDRVTDGLIAIILVAVLLRSVGTLVPGGDALGSLPVALMGLFSLLLLLTFWSKANVYIYPPVYFIVQAAVTVTLLLLLPEQDYYAVFFGILSVQVTRIYPRNIALRWIALFTLLTGVSLIYASGWREALPFVVLYAALFFAMAYFVVLKNQAESSQQESQYLLKELRKAHETLQEHAQQIEELAIMEERNRLARDLHDSVTQSLYSLTLFTQAARDRAAVGDLEQTERSLARAADTAAQALKEMRLLVYELRPFALDTEDFVAALEQRLDMVEKRSGLQTKLLVEPAGDLAIADQVQDELFQISQEALNNALKHARATAVTIRIQQQEKEGLLRMEIIDDGCGFDQKTAQYKGGLGLLSMQERTENIGGVLAVESSPGTGTRVCVELELAA